MEISKEAEALNTGLQQAHPQVFSMLSKKGRSFFFPKSGILSQTAEAKGKKMNATIGICLEEDGSPMRLPTIQQHLTLSPGEIFPYAPSFGSQQLREEWKSMLLSKNPSLQGKEFSLPIVTCGLTNAVAVAAAMFVDSGEKVITPGYYWENYDLTIAQGCNASLVKFSTFKGSQFNIEGLRGKLLSKGEKKVVILNFPNNPTGFTLRKEEAPKVVEVIREAAEKGKQIVVLLDDAYFGLVFEEDALQESLFGMLADLSPNVLVVKIDGATKEDFVWGLRVGFVTFAAKGAAKGCYAPLENKAAGALRGSISNASNLSQSLVLKAYQSSTYQEEKNAKFELLKKRFNEVKRVLAAHPEFREEFVPEPFNAGYFLCFKLKHADAETVRKKLLETYSTGIIAFGSIIRFAFVALPLAAIEPAITNIFSACRDCRKP